MFVSDYFQLNDEQFSKFVDMRVFDALLDKDSNFFINIIRLKKSTVPEFVEAYTHLNQFFSDIATLLDAADEPSMKDKMYRAARNKFHFHEVNGINLGFASSRYGAGWGQVTSDQFLRDAYQIVKKGSKQPEIFHLVSLFEENVAGDRLSDMIATIIEPEIKKYTLRVMNELGITRVTHKDLMFLPNGLIQNPFKNAPILLLPEEILHELPIAKDWDDIDRVAFDNSVIRAEVSAEIGAEWSRWASVDKKGYLKLHVFMEPEVCDRVISGYRKEDLDVLNLKENPEYLAELLLKKIKKSLPFTTEDKRPTSFKATMEIIGIFKDWVENNRGWAEIQNAPTKKREKAVQRFMHLGAKYYVSVNDLDISCEADEGRGPVDIKLSRGRDKTLAEIKLSSNAQYLHGYQAQVEEYGAAERTRNLIYVFVDVGNPGRLKTIKMLHRKNQIEGKDCPELVIIDARPKKAASTYNEQENYFGVDFDFGDMMNIDLSGLEDIDLINNENIPPDIADINLSYLTLDDIN